MDQASGQDLFRLIPSYPATCLRPTSSKTWPHPAYTGVLS